MIAQRHNSAFAAPGLPPEQWPPAERAILMERHAASDDPFAEVPASATWSTAYRRTVAMSYRRWLGFIAAFDPASAAPLFGAKTPDTLAGAMSKAPPPTETPAQTPDESPQPLVTPETAPNTARDEAPVHTIESPVLQRECVT